MNTGDKHTEIMTRLRREITEQHPEVFTEDNEDVLVLPTRGGFVMLDISLIAEQLLDMTSP